MSALGLYICMRRATKITKCVGWSVGWSVVSRLERVDASGLALDCHEQSAGNWRVSWIEVASHVKGNVHTAHQKWMVPCYCCWFAADDSLLGPWRVWADSKPCGCVCWANATEYLGNVGSSWLYLAGSWNPSEAFSTAAEFSQCWCAVWSHFDDGLKAEMHTELGTNVERKFLGYLWRNWDNLGPSWAHVGPRLGLYNLYSLFVKHAIDICIYDYIYMYICVYHCISTPGPPKLASLQELQPGLPAGFRKYQGFNGF